MPTRSTRARPKRPRGTARAGSGRSALERRLLHLKAQIEAERRKHARQIAAAARAADRRLAALMREITALRHHEARADALARLVAERDTALAERARRIEELQAALLRTPTHLG